MNKQFWLKVSAQDKSTIYIPVDQIKAIKVVDPKPTTPVRIYTKDGDSYTRVMSEKFKHKVEGFIEKIGGETL